MKNMLCLFLVFLFACSVKEKPAEINNLKDLIFQLDKENARVVLHIKKEVLEGGNKPADKAVLDKAKDILARRNTLQSKETFLSDYLHLLSIEYSAVAEKDSSRLKRAADLISSFKTKSDSSVYYNGFSNLLLIENDILKSLAERVGGSCRFYNQYATIYKERDTISNGETYSLVIIPDLHCPNTVDVNVDSNIKLFHNGTRVDIPVTIEKTGGFIVLKVSPKNPGNYKIAGELNLKSKTVDFTLSNKYSDDFYVK